MKSFTRADRVGALIQETLSDILIKNIQDPRLELTTITSVKLTNDLRYARIYFSIAGGKEKVDLALEGFKSAHGYIKRILASQLGLRYMPELNFEYDVSFDYGAHIDRLLKSVADESEKNESQSTE